MHPWLKMLLGGGLVLTGLPIALLALVAVANCDAACVERGERLFGIVFVSFWLVLGLVGAYLVRRGYVESTREA